jgi:A/G-specific adenine glycosylase
LVAEVLSHQTQLSRVIPVYEAVLARYPTVQAMAGAPLDDVKSITDPLGYKVRGRWLHASALAVAEGGAAVFPQTLDELRRLPGVGRYTAGALMSFAHHRDAPILDTNVARVLRRYFGIPVPARARTQVLWELAAAIIPRGKGPLINQALMDLGAMVCRSRNPDCDVCPLRRGCRWRVSSIAGAL